MANSNKEDATWLAMHCFSVGGPVVRGRELKAIEVFQETLTYYAKLQEDG